MKKKKYIYIYICHTMIGKIQNMHNKQDREKKKKKGVHVTGLQAH